MLISHDIYICRQQVRICQDANAANVQFHMKYNKFIQSFRNLYFNNDIYHIRPMLDFTWIVQMVT